MRINNLLVLSTFLGLTAPLFPAPSPKPNPILVELFTSQGCSSCPSGERWLNREGMALFRKGKIVPLAFHVAYWDYLGWKDPFSSSLFTERQKAYGAAFRSRSIYTPQMVVGGRTSFVGSDARKAERALADPENIPPEKPIPLRLVSTARGTQLEMDLTGLKDKSRVWLTVFENHLVTKVGQGENAGETLEENFVVRSLEEVKVKPGTFTVRLRLPSSGNPDHRGAVVFAQDPSTLRVLSIGFLYPLIPGCPSQP